MLAKQFIIWESAAVEHNRMQIVNFSNFWITKSSRERRNQGTKSYKLPSAIQGMTTPSLNGLMQFRFWLKMFFFIERFMLLFLKVIFILQSFIKFASFLLLSFEIIEDWLLAVNLFLISLANLRNLELLAIVVVTAVMRVLPNHFHRSWGNVSLLVGLKAKLQELQLT